MRTEMTWQEVYDERKLLVKAYCKISEFGLKNSRGIISDYNVIGYYLTLKWQEKETATGLFAEWEKDNTKEPYIIETKNAKAFRVPTGIEIEFPTGFAFIGKQPAEMNYSMFE